MPLLATPNVKNSHILTKKNFAFLKKKKRRTPKKVFQYQI